MTVLSTAEEKLHTPKPPSILSPLCHWGLLSARQSTDGSPGTSLSFLRNYYFKAPHSLKPHTPSASPSGSAQTRPHRSHHTGSLSFQVVSQPLCSPPPLSNCFRSPHYFPSTCALSPTSTKEYCDLPEPLRVWGLRIIICNSHLSALGFSQILMYHLERVIMH